MRINKTKLTKRTKDFFRNKKDIKDDYYADVLFALSELDNESSDISGSNCRKRPSNILMQNSRPAKNKGIQNNRKRRRRHKPPKLTAPAARTVRNKSRAILRTISEKISH